MKYYNSKENSKNIICEIDENTTRVATGSEGTVYKINEDTVAKILHDDLDSDIKKLKDKKLKEKKLIKMLKSAENARSHNINLNDFSAWPQEILYDESGNFAGYTMQFVANGKLLRYGIDKFNLLNWKERVILAANLSAAVHNVHQLDYVIGGQLTPENVMYYRDEKSGKYIIILIDCDSFQYKDDDVFYPCTVYDPNYVAPEMQGKVGIEPFTKESDYFSLAIIIYQLLSYGVNPFRVHYLGDGENKGYTIPKNIQNGRCPIFPETCIDKITGEKLPIEIAECFPLYPDKIFPPEICKLFKKTFVDAYQYDQNGNVYVQRASAKEWYVALKYLFDNLIQCTNNKNHYYFDGFKDCPLCLLNHDPDVIGDVFEDLEPLEHLEPLEPVV